MRILITGSSGQIGTNLALRLLDVGYNVFGADRRLNTWTDRITTLLQEVLEQCATVDEAVAHLSSRPLAGGALIMLADATGAIAAVELAPDEIAVRRGDSLVHTNHALTADIEPRDIPPAAVFPRWWRPRTTNCVATRCWRA